MTSHIQTEQKLLLIIGAPRSGTTWLQAMLGAHPRISTTVELTLYSRYIAPWLDAWRLETENIQKGRWVQGLPHVWTEEELYDFFRQFTAQVYQRVLETKPQADYVLDKHPGYSYHVQTIHRIWPQVRFIHLIRDGRDVAISMVAARRRIGFGAGTLPRAAEVWREYVLAARQAQQYAGQYLEIRYEDLLSNGVETLALVFSFCQIPAGRELVAAIFREHRFERMKKEQKAGNTHAPVNIQHFRQGRSGTWQVEMSALERYIFDQKAGDLLRSLGYAEGEWWATSTAERLLLPLPATTLIAGRAARQRLFRGVAGLLGPDLSAKIRARWGRPK